MKLTLQSLGCAKNQVDSEIMLGRLKQAGWVVTDDPQEADTIVVNTCSFIESAAQESRDHHQLENSKTVHAGGSWSPDACPNVTAKKSYRPFPRWMSFSVPVPLIRL
jgi:hypothetical protein